MGITSFAVLSDGSEMDNPRLAEKAQQRIRLAQRRLARREKLSTRRRKAVRMLARQQWHLRARRSDFHHKASRSIVNRFGVIAVEKLNVKGLAASRLAKQVNDAGWASFLYKLSYKAADAGRVLIRVNPDGTSQTCPCGNPVPKSLNERWHECPACGLSVSRDHASAIEILRRGLRLHALTDAAVMTPLHEKEVV